MEQRNANLFIVNNANPFLVTPYSPSQPTQSIYDNCQTVVTNNIQSSDPTAVSITVQSNLDIAPPYNVTLGGNTLYTDRLYTSGPVSGNGPGISAISTPPSVQTTIDGTTTEVLTERGQTLYTDGSVAGSGSYIISINGMLQMQRPPVTGPFVTPAGYLPIQIGTPPQTYYIQLFTTP